MRLRGTLSLRRTCRGENLIGYFYSDCPAWVHEREFNAWKGPMFDPERLESEAGRRELRNWRNSTIKRPTTRFAATILITFSSATVTKPMHPSPEVYEEALPFVDVLSFQDFRIPVIHLEEWHKKTGKPVLLADAAGVNFRSGAFFKSNNGTWYADTLNGIFENPGCIGFHLCGLSA